MRVVAGSVGGRRLSTPSGRKLRPTSDRVRQATFNALQSQAGIDGAVVLDLFAGTGALGIEALSRGASWATFVDISKECTDLVEANLLTCGFESQSEVLVADGPKWIFANKGPWDLVLLDPPYAFDNWRQLLDGPLVDSATGVVVVESDREVDPGPLWNVRSTRRHGSTVVVILTPTD